jgi:VWFA-related protein
VDAEVLAKDGRIITGLTKDDFRVFDEGQEQRLVGFATEEQPLDIILLFDTSGSMRSKVEKATAASAQALHQLRDGDRVAIMTFSDRSALVAPFTMDLDAVERDIKGILDRRFDGGTNIQGALVDAGNYFLANRPKRGRRATLLISDNIGHRTRKDISVVHVLWEADAVLCGLAIRDPGYPARRAIVAVVAPYALAKVGGVDPIAEKTGGEIVRMEDPGAGFPEMMRRLRSRYSLYYPTPEGKPGSSRTIRVELSAAVRNRFPDARVYARRGYILTQPQ